MDKQERLHDSTNSSELSARSVLVVGHATDSVVCGLKRVAAHVDAVNSLEEGLEALSHEVYGLVLIAQIDGALDAVVEATTGLRIATAPTPVGVIGELALGADAPSTFAFALPSPVSDKGLMARVAEAFLVQLPSTSPEISVFRAYFEALAKHEWAKLAELCHPEVVYHLPVPGPYGRMVSGRDAFIAYAAEVIPTFVDAHFDPIVVYKFSHGHAVRYRGSWQGPNGERHRMAGSIVFRVRAGKIERIGVDLDHRRLGAVTSPVTHNALEISELNHRLRARLEDLSERHGVTPREREVLDLLLLGRTSAEVGEALGITARTAKFHVGNLLKKLGAESRNDLLRSLL